MLKTLKALKQKGGSSTTVPPTPIFCPFLSVFGGQRWIRTGTPLLNPFILKDFSAVSQGILLSFFSKYYLS